MGKSPFVFLLVTNFQVALVCAAVAWAVRPAPREGFYILSAAALGFAGAALVQNKGWSYHWYPSAAFCWLLLGLVSIEVISRGGSERATRKIAAPSIIGFGTLILSATALFTAPHKAKAENPVPALFTSSIHELGGGPVMIFSNAVRASYPLVTQPGIDTSFSRLPTMALLSAAIASREAGLELFLRDIIVADMLKKPPQLLIAETGAAGRPAAFDFIEYFSQDPVFARELQSFQLAREIGNFRFYQRIKPYDAKVVPNAPDTALNPLPRIHKHAHPARVYNQRFAFDQAHIAVLLRGHLHFDQ